MTFKKFKFIMSECFSGSSLLRAHQNYDFMEHVYVHGKTIDLGAKNGTYAYHKLISQEIDTDMTYSDLYPKAPNIIKVDFDQKLPLKDNSFDNILLFNVLEHVWDTENLLSECNRILTKGGTLYGAVPFLFRYHPDPTDYWRFTCDSMEKLLITNNFKKIEIVTHGVGCFTVSANTFTFMFRVKILVSIVWALALFLDYLLSKIWSNNKTFYLGIFFKAQK